MGSGCQWSVVGCWLSVVRLPTRPGNLVARSTVALLYRYAGQLATDNRAGLAGVQPVTRVFTIGNNLAFHSLNDPSRIFSRASFINET